MPASSGPPSRPVSLLIAAGLTAAASAFMLVTAALTVLAQQTALSAGIAAVLVAWGAILAVAAWGLFCGRRWSRGPVVAGGLLHLASFANFVGSQPLAVVPAAIALVTVVAAVWPTTTAALHLGEPDA